MKDLKTRNEIDDIYKWRLEDMFETAEEWQKAADEAESQIVKMAKHRGKFTKTGAALYSCISEMYELSRKIMKIYVYAHMKRDEDSTNAKSQELAGKADYLITKFSEATSFFEPELLRLESKRIEAMARKTSKLREYSFVIDEIMRKKAHVLSPGEEKILAMSGEATSTGQDVFMMFNNADIKFEPFSNEQGEKQNLLLADM